MAPPSAGAGGACTRGAPGGLGRQAAPRRFCLRGLDSDLRHAHPCPAGSSCDAQAAAGLAGRAAAFLRLSGAEALFASAIGFLVGGDSDCLPARPSLRQAEEAPAAACT